MIHASFGLKGIRGFGDLEASNDPRKAFSRGKNKDALVPWLPPIIF
jgi:hypothetical protein